MIHQLNIIKMIKRDSKRYRERYQILSQEVKKATMWLQNVQKFLRN